MEYPESKITKPTRITILVLFIALFCIIAPAIIMYTSGYRWDFKRGLLRETGAINIDIEPSGASVFLGGTYIKSEMPVRLNDRIPGKFNILITAPGYFDWQKEIEVKNKQTVYIKEVSMLKKNEPDHISDGDIREIKLSPDKLFIAYVKINADSEELVAKNLSNGDEIILKKITEKNQIIYQWSPNSQYIVESNSVSPFNRLNIININNPDKTIDVMAITKYPIDKYMWKEGGSPELYFGTKLRLMSILADTEQKYVLSKTNWLDWHMENGQLWTLQKSASTSQIKLVKDTLGFKSDFTDEKTFLPSEQNFSILTAQDNRILLKKNGKSEMILITKDNKYVFSGEKYRVSDFNNWWLIWTPWEIWTYSPGGEPNLLNRSGEGLQDVLPLDEYNTLALIWSDKTTALYPYYLVTHDLINNTLKSAAVDANNHRLYFSAKIGDKEGLWKLDY